LVDTAEKASQAVIDMKEAGYDYVKVYSFLTEECYDAIIDTAKEIGIKVIGHISYNLSTEYIVESGQILIAHSEEVMKHANGDYSEENIDYLAGIITNSDTWIIPTLVTTRNFISTFDNLEEKLKASEIKYLHPMAAGAWTFINNMAYLSMPEEVR